MRRVLASCIGAVVTTNAIARDIDVIEVGRDPRNRRMAVIAVFAARDVGRVLARGGVAIVAGSAGPEDLGMVDHVSRRKCHVVVAVLAYVARIDVRGVLTRGLHAIMTIDAVARDVGVIKIGWSPRDSGVPIVTIVAARDVGRMFSSCCIAVMACVAAAKYLRVIDGEYR